MFCSVTLVFYGWFLDTKCQKNPCYFEFVSSINKLYCKFDKILPTVKGCIYAIFSSSGLEGECHGPTTQYRVCENPSCPAGVPAFRDWQCQAFSVRSSYQKHVHQWQAVIDDGKYKPSPLFLPSAYMAWWYCWSREIQLNLKQTNNEWKLSQVFPIYSEL